MSHDVSLSPLDQLREKIPDFAKDIRINLGSVLTPEGAPDLEINRIYGIALASAYATKNPALVEALEQQVSSVLSEAEVTAAKSAATIMAMNNVYYRFIHLMGDADLKGLPAKLRMTVIGQPGIPKVDFELFALAVSSINGCGMCMEAHVHEVVKAGVSKLGVQSAIRIAAVVQAASQALFFVR